MWWQPPITEQTGPLIYYILVYVLYDTAATFVYMPYFALTPELTLDYDERTSLTGYRMVFRSWAASSPLSCPESS